MLEQELNQNSNLLTDENQTQIVNVKISDIYPNNTQPRIHFDEDKIIALCEYKKTWRTSTDCVEKRRRW